MCSLEKNAQNTTDTGKSYLFQSASFKPLLNQNSNQVEPSKLVTSVGGFGRELKIGKQPLDVEAQNLLPSQFVNNSVSVHQKVQQEKPPELCSLEKNAQNTTDTGKSYLSQSASFKPLLNQNSNQVEPLKLVTSVGGFGRELKIGKQPLDVEAQNLLPSQYLKSIQEQEGSEESESEILGKDNILDTKSKIEKMLQQSYNKGHRVTPSIEVVQVEEGFSPKDKRKVTNEVIGEAINESDNMDKLNDSKQVIVSAKHQEFNDQTSKNLKKKAKNPRSLLISLPDLNKMKVENSEG